MSKLELLALYFSLDNCIELDSIGAAVADANDVIDETQRWYIDAVFVGLQHIVLILKTFFSQCIYTDRTFYSGKNTSLHLDFLNCCSFCCCSPWCLYSHIAHFVAVSNNHELVVLYTSVK